MGSQRSVATMIAVLAALAGSGCGVEGRRDDTLPSTIAPATAPAPISTAPTAIAGIDEPATVTTVAERVDDALQITWIGGSEIDLDGRSLPDAVAIRKPTAAGRVLHIFADPKIAPLPHEIIQAVERAAARNTNGLVVILNPAWLSWDGHSECSGIALPHDFYTCVLTPQPETEVGALRSDVAALIEAIVTTGIPAYVYVIPHSAESLAHPTLAPLLAATESEFADLDPGIAHIKFVGHIISRDLEPLREGVEFHDMVHPSELGIERLADFFAAEFARFFAAQAPS